MMIITTKPLSVSFQPAKHMLISTKKTGTPKIDIKNHLTKLKRPESKNPTPPEGPRHNLHKAVHRNHMARKPSPEETNWGSKAAPDRRNKTRWWRPPNDQEKKLLKAAIIPLWNEYIYIYIQRQGLRGGGFLLKNGNRSFRFFFAKRIATREGLVLDNPGLKAELIDSGHI